MGQNFRVSGKFLISRRKLSQMGRATCGHVEPINIATNHKDCRRMESYSIHTSVRGYHFYKDVWEAALGQLLHCQREPGDIHDLYAMAVVETGVATRIVAYVPRAISSVCYFFLGKSGSITCKVTGSRQVNEFG